MSYVEAEGIDYTPEGIEALRQQCVEWRNKAYKQMPDSSGFIVGITHVIAILHYTIHLQQEAKKNAGR